MTQNCCDPKNFDLNFFWPTKILTQKNLLQNFFWAKIFLLTQKISDPKNCFGLKKLFWPKNIFWTQELIFFSLWIVLFLHIYQWRNFKNFYELWSHYSQLKMQFTWFSTLCRQWQLSSHINIEKYLAPTNIFVIL